jgi:glycerophosphoryl diester phosphodiesterase
MNPPITGSWPWPRVIAHRGAGRFAPENTLAAIREGHARGFRAVEFDVMLSADGVAVLIHDETLERTTNGRGEVANTDHATLRRLDAGSWLDPRFRGEPIPDFSEAAALCASLGLWANIEIKPAPGHEEATGREAARTATKVWSTTERRHQPLLTSFSEAALVAAREVAPHLPRGLLVDTVPDDWERRLKSLDCVSLNCNQDRLEVHTARAVVAAGYGLAAWTVNDPAIARRLFDWGVHALFTDRLDLLGPDFA